MTTRRRDDLGRHPEDAPEDPSMRAHEARVRNAQLARQIGREQTLSGSSTNVTASRFDAGRYREVVSRNRRGELRIDWERVGEGDT